MCDLPYGTTDCKWDTVIPFTELWPEYRRILKSRGAAVLFCAQPFTSNLIVSNIREYSHVWYWHKNNAVGHLNANKQPLRNIEDIAVFILNRKSDSPGISTYNPQGLTPCKPVKHRGKSSGVYRAALKETIQRYTNYPRQLLSFRNEFGLHPTQKPVALLEYLVRTYSNEGELVLDNCMGSGSTGVACANTGRRFIGIEKEKKYFDIASERISGAFDCANIER